MKEKFSATLKCPYFNYLNQRNSRLSIDKRENAKVSNGYLDFSRPLVILLACVLFSCNEHTKQPSLIVNELPLIYESVAHNEKKRRHTKLNISVKSGLKLLGSPLKLTLEEQESGTHVTLNNGVDTLISADYYEPNLQGLCIDTIQNTIIFFIDHVAEGIGQPMHDILHKNALGQWQFTKLAVMEETYTIDQFMQCETPQATPHWDDILSQINVNVCSCNIPESVFAEPAATQWRSAIGKIYERALFELDDIFDKGAAYPVTLFEVQHPKKLATLIEQAELDENYEVTQFTHGDASLLIINQYVSPFDNIGYGFIRNNPQIEWQLWYTAGDSSKAFHPISNATQRENNSVNLELCMRDCNWWGERAYIDLDISKMTFQKELD